MVVCFQQVTKQKNAGSSRFDFAHRPERESRDPQRDARVPFGSAPFYFAQGKQGRRNDNVGGGFGGDQKSEQERK